MPNYQGVWSLTARVQEEFWLETSNQNGFYSGLSHSDGTNEIHTSNLRIGNDTVDFGDLSSVNKEGTGVSSSTRGVFCGGASFLNTMEYITMSTAGNTTDFGNLLTTVLNKPGGLGSNTRGVIMGGNDNSTGNINVMQYITIANTGNATDFGNLSAVSTDVATCNSNTRGIMHVGGQGSGSDILEYITIASTGNSTDFGNLLASTSELECGGGNSAKGLFAGGSISGTSRQNTIQFLVIASTGNTADFGDLTVGRGAAKGCSGFTNFTIVAGQSPSAIVSNIDKVNISTNGNAVDFGFLSVANSNKHCAISDSHGGL